MTADYGKVLRIAADQFAMAVAVIAEREGRVPSELAVEAIGDALARLNETGVLGAEEDDA